MLFTMYHKIDSQGSTPTFQFTSLVASDNLDLTSQNLFLLAKHCDWLAYYMKFSRHVYFTIWGWTYFATLKCGDFAKILYFESLQLHNLE